MPDRVRPLRYLPGGLSHEFYDVLADVLAEGGPAQYHIAEIEKYAYDVLPERRRES